VGGKSFLSITNCLGYQTSSCSYFPKESEVLLPPNTVLKIEKVYFLS